jgi:hypothetical protein
MITKTDTDLATRFMPNAAAPKQEATAKAIANAMLPERQALSDLVMRIEAVQSDPTFKAVFEAAKGQGVFFRGKPWKEELERAQAIVATYPLPEIENEP